MSAAGAPKPISRFGWIPAVIVLGGVAFLWHSCGGMTYDDKPAGESIAAAVESFKQKNGRFPGKLEELVPAYLPELPKAGKYFPIAYASEPGGSQCWVAYQVHRDSYEEYDCLKRSWSLLEVEDSHVFRHPKTQYIKPEGRQ